MNFAFVVLAVSLVAAAMIVAFALRRPAAAPDPRLDQLMATQGEIAGQFKQTIAIQAELQRIRKTWSFRLSEVVRRLAGARGR